MKRMVCIWTEVEEHDMRLWTKKMGKKTKENNFKEKKHQTTLWITPQTPAIVFLISLYTFFKVKHQYKDARLISRRLRSYFHLRK